MFLRLGFHAASLDAIAEEAGYTKGAVYSNFTSKDDLFLAVLEDHFRERAQVYSSLILDQARIEDSYRAVARYWRDSNVRQPEWSRLVVEFLAHASRHEPLRQATLEVHVRGIAAIADLVEALARRHGVEFNIPTQDVVRGSGALNRGLAVEQLLDPDLPADVFEEMHLAYMRGVTKSAPAPGRAGESAPCVAEERRLTVSSSAKGLRGTRARASPMRCVRRSSLRGRFRRRWR